METLRYTLIADGSSDKTLLRIIKWLLNDLYEKLPTDGALADFRSLPNPPKTLSDKLIKAKQYYPFDILFVHRDAESNNNKIIEKRISEVKKQIGSVEFERTVCIVPVKMMETWLLINSEAIKKAAGNRNFPGTLNLPSLKKLEAESQPKELLHNILAQASGLKGRNLEKFNKNRAVHLVAEYIQDYNLLRQLHAFQIFETELKQKIDLLLL